VVEGRRERSERGERDSLFLHVTLSRRSENQALLVAAGIKHDPLAVDLMKPDLSTVGVEFPMQFL
jgi:hypothetical protein